MQAAATRAGTMRDFLDLLESRRPGARESVLDCFPPESRKLLEEKLGLSWLPIEHGHFALEGIFEVLGERDGVAFFRESMASIVNRPIFRSFVQGLLSIWRRDRGRLFQQLPRGWELAFRGFCQVTALTPQPGETHVVFDQIALEVRRHPLYLRCWEGICLGLLDLTGVEGTLDYTIAPDFNRVEAVFRWRSA